MARRVSLVALVLMIYVGSYLAFRQTHAEVWARDRNAYVIFPERWSALYYLWRPLSYLDGALTGMRVHIGPHR